MYAFDFLLVLEAHIAAPALAWVPPSYTQIEETAEFASKP